MYVDQAQRIFREVDPYSHFCVYPDDLRIELPVPVITKSRKISDFSQCVLLPLNYNRHWGDISLVEDLDIPFSQKDDKLIWRGATTGKFLPQGDEPYSSRAYVYKVKPKNENIDIGFNQTVQFPQDWPVLELLKGRLKPPIKMGEQLRSKYLLSLEGNDVATGLKWMLYSNSVVIMPPPVCESWACESFLVPFEHYVPVAYDLSDLNEVYEWCVSHPRECESIASNGREFIKRFLDPQLEGEIAREVATAYLDTVCLIGDQDSLLPIQLAKEVLYARAEKLQQKGDVNAAQDLFLEGAKRFPNWLDIYGDPNFLKSFVKLCLVQGRHEHVRDMLSALSSGRQGWHEILFARDSENKGLHAKALDHWRAFLASHPEHTEAQQAVRRLGLMLQVGHS
ncbi:glycosyl transferase family 90 [Paracoccus ravus]|uniref:glycosyl transferase family 90 n=1 Tax=Paracoccus ravus TaxID=2447760 RepID=UPI00143014D2|nr:glycosyl transferase family 90 [Paracoccus ravus]